MMKIPLIISEQGILVDVVVKLNKRLRQPPRVMRFIIDTGSPLTFLTEKYSNLYGFATNGEFVKHFDMGATKFELRKIGNGSLVFKTGNDIKEFDMNQIHIGYSTKTDEHSRQVSLSYPCILGMDFLKMFKLKLVVDPPKDVAYLEDSE